MFKCAFAFLLLIAIFPIAVVAQDDEIDPCDPTAFAEALEGFAAEVREADDPAAVLDEATAWLDAQRGVCERASEATGDAVALTFTSEEEGLNPSIGPVSIPDGIYRVTLVTNGSATVQATAISGVCSIGDTVIAGSIMVFTDMATEGASSFLYAEGCETLLTVSNATEAWQVDLVEISPSDAEVLGAIYSSADVGMTALIGPVAIPEGTYRITATTDSYVTFYFEILDGECGNRFGISIYAFGPESSEGATEVFQSEGCVVLITTGTTTAPWTLEWERVQ